MLPQRKSKIQIQLYYPSTKGLPSLGESVKSSIFWLSVCSFENLSEFIQILNGFLLIHVHQNPTVFLTLDEERSRFFIQNDGSAFFYEQLR